MPFTQTRAFVLDRDIRRISVAHMDYRDKKQANRDWPQPRTKNMTAQPAGRDRRCHHWFFLFYPLLQLAIMLLHPPVLRSATPENSRVVFYRDALKAQGAPAAAEALIAAVAQSDAPAALADFLYLVQGVADKSDKERRGPVAVAEALRAAQRDDLAAEFLMLLSGHSQDDHYSRVRFMNDTLLNQAAGLLKSSDPFTRGMAAWSIHTTVTKDNDGGEQRWPAPNPPPWFTAYESLPITGWTEREHVLQVVTLGRHRTAAELQGDLLARRKSAMELSDWTANTHKERIAPAGKLIALCNPAAIGAAPDIATARNLYLQCRLSLRNAVFALIRDDIPHVAYIERRGFVGQHNISGGSPSPLRHPPGTDILLDDVDPDTPPVRLLNNQLGPGAVRGFDLFYDASRFVFAFASIPKWSSQENNYAMQEWKIKGAVPQDLYEMDVGGSGIRRLTTDTTWNDTEPTYLPDGSVVFASDRGCGASQCGTFEQSTAALNLFRLWPADGRVKRLTYNKDFDRYPHVLNNGLIGFLRWDYQERHLFQPHTLWSMRPDGTQPDAFYKQHFTDGPLSLRDAMPIPGSSKLIAIGTGHHHIPEGVLIRVTPDYGVNNPKGMEILSLGSSPVQGGIAKEIQPVPEGGVLDSIHGRGGWYQTPWALDEMRFLAGHTPHLTWSAGYRLVYLDVWGNKELIAESPYREIAYPIVVKPRQAPPKLPEMEDNGGEYATTYVDNVYADLPGVAKGAAKYIRISSRPDWPYFKDDYGALRWIPDFGFKTTFGYWSWSPARVIGTVPVEDNGSAFFKVPARMAVYFQLLDENKMEIRRMRSHVEFQRGEFRSCVGCHETRTDVVVASSSYNQGLALKRPPSTPQPPPFGGDKLLDFEAMVQPVFDQRCVSCHGQENPKGGLELAARKDGFGFMQSYRSLFGLQWGQPLPMEKSHAEWYGKNSGLYQAGIAQYLDQTREWGGRLEKGETMPGQLVSVIDRHTDASISQPYQFGSSKSKLITTLLKDPEHCAKAKLTPAEWETLVTWVDAGAPYSGRFFLKQGPGGTVLPKPIKVEVLYPDPWKSPGELSAVGRPVVPPDLAPGPGHKLNAN